MEWWDITNKLLAYAVTRYPTPTIKWDKRKFELRSYEIFTYEQVFTICLNKPFTDPIDIFEDYLIQLYMAEKEYSHDKKRLDEYIVMRKVIQNLINKYHSKELSSGRIYI